MKFYHYTSREYAEKIAKEEIFRLSDINKTTDHTEGYHCLVEELYSNLPKSLGVHYRKFLEYRKQIPSSIFFGSLTTFHHPKDFNNPLWRKYAVRNLNKDEPKFGTGVCVEFEFDYESFSESALVQLNMNNFLYFTHYRDPLTKKDFLGQTILRKIQCHDVNPFFGIKFGDIQDLKNEVDETKIEQLLKFYAFACSYFYKSEAHKAEHEIRVLVYTINENSGDDEQIHHLTNLKIRNVSLHDNPKEKNSEKNIIFTPINNNDLKLF